LEATDPSTVSAPGLSNVADGVIGHRHAPGARGGLLEGFTQHDRDDLPGMPDPVGRQRHDGRADISAGRKEFRRLDRATDRLVGEDIQHPRRGPTCSIVDPADPALRDAAGDQDRVRRPGHDVVGIVSRPPGDFRDAVDARDVAADMGIGCGLHGHTFIAVAWVSARSNVR
jgi:hypothetical protein